MAVSKEKANLQELYEKEVRPQLQKDLNIANVMQIPKIEKIVVNVGVKEAVGDSKILLLVEDVIGKITGQRPVRTFARKSIAGFKIREGMPLGVKVTLRKKRMYEFLDRLINLSLPKVRDFQGVPTKFDKGGNYNLGIKEWNIFPEIDYKVSEKVHGLNITIQTSAYSGEHAFALLKSFGMPFRKNK